MQIVIEIDEARFKDIQRISKVQLEMSHFQTAEQIIAKGVPIEQEPCADAISRQEAIDTIESWLSCDDYNEAERHIMRAMQSVLYDLPPVNPQKNIVNNGTMNITL